MAMLEGLLGHLVELWHFKDNIVPPQYQPENTIHK